MIERPANDAGQHGRTADALDLWRAGERNVTRRTLNSDWRDDYQDAVKAAVAHLQRYSTMAELISTYFDLDDDAWLDALCRRSSGRILNFGDVEDAAYWRRAQQLITAATTGGTGERSG
ncbi:MAG TPA: hypothetical protein VIU62_22060 [Chloroflexota bacterium]|jgi:hypothetical protein